MTQHKHTESKLRSRWRRLRPAALILLALTGAGAPAVTAFITAADVAVEVIDDTRAATNGRD